MVLTPQTTTCGSSQYPNTVFDWAYFNQGQKQWPIPKPLLMTVFFLLGVFVPLFGGAVGMVAAFLLSAFYPTPLIRGLWVKRSLVDINSIVACVMMLGNLDALGDMLGSDVIRFSWLSLGMATISIVYRIGELSDRRVVGSCFGFVLLICFHIFTSVGNTSIIRAVELNGSVLAAFLLTLICLSKREVREALVLQLVLFSVLNCGFSFFELLVPSNTVSISSSRIGDETVRSAGIYANAIVSGVMISVMLLLATVTCTRGNPSKKERLSLLLFAVYCSVGVLVTFSRSAMVIFFFVTVLVAFRIAGNKFAKLSHYLPFALGMIAFAFFGIGEFLNSRGALRTDATRRYDALREVMMGDIQPVWEALRERSGAWEPSRRLWETPRLIGHGFNYIAENEIYPPHNMVILILSETGVLGLLFWAALVVYFFNIGNWKPTPHNLALFLTVLLPIGILIIESHSMFTRRYFTLPLVLLVFTTSILFNKSALNR